MSQEPLLPYGSPSILSGIAENFAFHSSPESFITARSLAFQKAHPHQADSRIPIRAKVLNRDVAVISSYDQVRQILCDEEITSFLSSSQAYDELMAPFFPPPNLLLHDPPDHQERKNVWVERIATLHESIRPLVCDIVLDHFRNIPSGSTVDLYKSMKHLSWRILLSIFIQKDDDEKGGEHADIEALHEDLLRGQFSLFPVSINTRLWRSPRSKGLHARQKLQSILGDKVAHGRCPFAVGEPEEGKDIANHLLLFTSSLAAKGLASLLSAVLLNLYFFKEGGSSLSTKIKTLEDSKQRSNYIQSMILEVERLSPPVVGIMRRTTQDIILRGNQESAPPTLIPKSWDLWLYFVGAGRDPTAFGDTADRFTPSRYYNSGFSRQEGFAFGAGAKSCLGKDVIRMTVSAVVETCLGQIQGVNSNSSSEDMVIRLQADVGDLPDGVQGWLGWKPKVSPEEWARDIKQLPTQRPRKPIMVVVQHQLAS
ncbi:MAG: hypothetical protein LQ341_003845 [Variospora aurantia]|nr:MAG: hypothetical protein LQ341_003845 [Variospora aurantia]